MEHEVVTHMQLRNTEMETMCQGRWKGAWTQIQTPIENWRYLALRTIKKMKRQGEKKEHVWIFKSSYTAAKISIDTLQNLLKRVLTQISIWFHMNQVKVHMESNFVKVKPMVIHKDIKLQKKCMQVKSHLELRFVELHI